MLSMPTEDRGTLEGDAGLCADCRHLVRVETHRGAVYVLCGFSKQDPSFPKYPPLPVRRCPAHAPRALVAETDTSE